MLWGGDKQFKRVVDPDMSKCNMFKQASEAWEKHVKWNWEIMMGKYTFCIVSPEANKIVKRKVFSHSKANQRKVKTWRKRWQEKEWGLIYYDAMISRFFNKNILIIKHGNWLHIDLAFHVIHHVYQSNNEFGWFWIKSIL